MSRTKHFCKIAGLLWLIPAITILARSVNYSQVISRNPVSKEDSSSIVLQGTVDQPQLHGGNNFWSNLESERISNQNRKRNRQKRALWLEEHAARILGFSVEYESDKKRVDHQDGSVQILEGLVVNLRLFGKFTSQTQFGYAKDEHCTKEVIPAKITIHKPQNGVSSAASVHLIVPSKHDYDFVYFCLQEVHGNTTGKWEPQDIEPWLRIDVVGGLLPLWIHILLLIFLLLLSGLFSGLNLGLMSLNKTDLKIIINTGNPIEKLHASKIAPVRSHGNFLLCSLLFSNVLVNASLTILVDELTSGVIAVIMSTMAIVIFGEIIPQAICSRYGLAVGARTIYITKFFMAITFPLAYPLSKVLDKILGEEIGNVYTRERLKELLKVTRDYHGLEVDEVGIISGTLDMKTKTVKDIMTNLDVVYMLPVESNLDYETIGDIEYHGFTRIPVYEKERSNVVSVLNVKQLTLLDAGDNIPIRTVVEYYQNSLFYVFENTRLDYMFKAFREGSRGHMAFVQKVNDEGPGDPYYETIGVVTMEDVLEELLQQEIMDESDVGKTARGPAARKERPKDPFHSNKRHKASIELPPPLVLAASQFLTTSVPPFHRDFISENVMKRLVQVYARETKPPKSKLHEVNTTVYLYEMGQPADYFILILEGRVEILVGKEKLNFEAGPFHQFGADFLTAESAKENVDDLLKTPKMDDSLTRKKTFIPDYTVKVVTDVVYIRLKYVNYRTCRVATEIERNFKDSTKAPDNWQDEIEKMLTYDDETESEIRRIEENQVNHVNFSSIEPPMRPMTNGSSDTTPRNNRKYGDDGSSKDESAKLL